MTLSPRTAHLAALFCTIALVAAPVVRPCHAEEHDGRAAATAETGSEPPAPQPPAPADLEPPATEPTADPGPQPQRALPLVSVPAQLVAIAPPSRPRGRRLRAAGWTLFGLGTAATATGLVLLPLQPEQVPLLTGILPMLSAGAAVMLLGQVLISAGEDRRRPVY